MQPLVSICSKPAASCEVVYLAIEQAAKKWSMPINNWKPALNQFMILYEDRLTEIF